jgi:hypothetical protein
VSVTSYRIVWEPGSDWLVGTCHCGAEHTADDPVRMWQWLLAHPDHPDDGHHSVGIARDDIGAHR